MSDRLRRSGLSGPSTLRKAPRVNHPAATAFRLVRLGTVLAGVFLLVPSSLRGQEVHARLEGEISGRPITGALVQLRSAVDRVVDEDLSGPAGGIRLSGDGGGVYRVRVQRIGYQTWTSEPFRLDKKGRPIRRTFRVPVSPVQLEQLDVPLEQRCELPAEQGRRMTKVWDQIETALALTSIRQASDSLVYTVRAFRRVLDRSGDFERLDTAAVQVRRSLRPFDPPSADSLANVGFMVEDAPGRYRYYAPTPEVLRSRAFLDTHCLGFRSGERVDRPGWIGVTFRPTPGRRLPDVEGALWIDRDRAWLRRLVFRYVNLGFPDTPTLTGRVEFIRLPAGRWIISRWSTQFPRLAFETNLYRNRPAQTVVSGIDEAGAEVLSVQAPDGEVLYHHRRGTVYGTVLTESIRDSPGNYVVRVASITPSAAEGRSDTTDAGGEYQIGMVSPGRYRLLVIPPGSQRATEMGTLKLRPGQVRQIDIRVGSQEE